MSNKKSVAVIGFSTQEVVTALLVMAHKQKRITKKMWEDMCSNENNPKYSYTIISQQGFSSVEIFKKEE